MERMLSGDAYLAAEQSSVRTRLMAGLALAGSVWLVGLVGHFTPLAEWPALFLYVIGSLSVALALGIRERLWDTMWITRRGLKRALAWGGGIGLALLVIDNINTYMYYRSGGAPMAQMEEILIGMRQSFSSRCLCWRKSSCGAACSFRVCTTPGSIATWRCCSPPQPTH